MALSKIGYSHYGAIVHSSTYQPWNYRFKEQKTVAQSLKIHLVDPKTKDELLILGTSNVSTSYAYKNFELAKAFKPTSVLLQVSPSFENYTQGNFSSSEAFQDHLQESGYTSNLPDVEREWGFKHSMFALRLGLMNWWLNTVMRTPEDTWRLFTPGLDSKLIHDLATSLKAEIHHGEEDFNAGALEALKTEKRMDLIYPALKYYFNINDSWRTEARSRQVMCRNHGIKAIAEGHFNQDNVAWVTKFMELLVPNQKKIIVDKRDEDIFWKVEKEMKGNKKLILVNQWHMDGIQRFWLRYRGLEPKRGPMMNTDDCPMEEIKNWIRATDNDREIVMQRTGSPMATHAKDLTPYWDETRSHYA